MIYQGEKDSAKFLDSDEYWTYFAYGRDAMGKRGEVYKRAFFQTIEDYYCDVSDDGIFYECLHYAHPGRWFGKIDGEWSEKDWLENDELPFPDLHDFEQYSKWWEDNGRCNTLIRD